MTPKQRNVGYFKSYARKSCQYIHGVDKHIEMNAQKSDYKSEFNFSWKDHF